VTDTQTGTQDVRTYYERMRIYVQLQVQHDQGTSWLCILYGGVYMTLVQRI